MNNNDKKIADAINRASNGKIGNEAINRAKNGDLSGVMSKLSREDATKLKEALSDEKKAKEILSSKEARALLNSLLGGK